MIGNCFTISLELLKYIGKSEQNTNAIRRDFEPTWSKQQTDWKAVGSIVVENYYIYWLILIIMENHISHPQTFIGSRCHFLQYLLKNKYKVKW